MSLMKKLFLAAALFMAAGTATQAFAQDQQDDYQVNFEEGGFAACTYGIFKGLTYVVIREVVGVVEVATFFAPLPGCSTELPDSPAWGYGPILEPEWIITPAQNKYNFVYPETRTMQ